VDAAGEVAQFVDGLAEVFDGLRQDCSGRRVGVVAEAGFGQPQCQGDGDQALLGAVV
jgi:hypothetical protein